MTLGVLQLVKEGIQRNSRKRVSSLDPCSCAALQKKELTFFTTPHCDKTTFGLGLFAKKRVVIAMICYPNPVHKQQRSIGRPVVRSASGLLEIASRAQKRPKSCY